MKRASEKWLCPWCYADHLTITRLTLDDYEQAGWQIECESCHWMYISHRAPKLDEVLLIGVKEKVDCER